MASNGQSLGSMKAVLNVLKERDIHVARSTIWLWRRKLPARQRPPVHMEIVRTKPRVVSSRRDLLEWVDRMEKQGLFDQTRRYHVTRKKKSANLASV